MSILISLACRRRNVATQSTQEDGGKRPLGPSCIHLHHSHLVDVVPVKDPARGGRLPDLTRLELASFGISVTVISCGDATCNGYMAHAMP